MRAIIKDIVGLSKKIQLMTQSLRLDRRGVYVQRLADAKSKPESDRREV